MNQAQVQCWEHLHYRVKNAPPDVLYIALSEAHMGYHLISCLNCGTIYAVENTSETQIGPPLSEKLVGITCIQCRSAIKSTWSPYPEKYLTDDGVISFDPPTIIPDDRDLMTRSFPSVYG